MSQTIQEIQEEIVEEFALFDDWLLRYEHLIQLGKSLPLLDEQYKTEDHIIKGCQSRVWLHAELVDGRLHFTADSDSVLTKGMIALLVRTFSGQPVEEILKSDATFVDKIGLREHLSPTRANGLLSMFKQIKLYAMQHVV